MARALSLAAHARVVRLRGRGLALAHPRAAGAGERAGDLGGQPHRGRCGQDAGGARHRRAAPAARPQARGPQPRIRTHLARALRRGARGLERRPLRRRAAPDQAPPARASGPGRPPTRPARGGGRAPRRRRDLARRWAAAPRPCAQPRCGGLRRVQSAGQRAAPPARTPARASRHPGAPSAGVDLVHALRAGAAAAPHRARRRERLRGSRAGFTPSRGARLPLRGRRAACVVRGHRARPGRRGRRDALVLRSPSLPPG